MRSQVCATVGLPLRVSGRSRLKIVHMSFGVTTACCVPEKAFLGCFLLMGRRREGEMALLGSRNCLGHSRLVKRGEASEMGAAVTVEAMPARQIAEKTFISVFRNLVVLYPTSRSGNRLF